MITAEKFNQGISALMRYERKTKKMSQQALASKINVSCQQIHKYESGVNSLSAFRLLQVAEALEISAEDFINRAIKWKKKFNRKLK